MSILFLSANATTMDEQKAQYKKLATEVVQAVVSENLSNITVLTDKLNQATNLGIQMAEEVSISNPNGKPLLHFLITNINRIKTSDIDTIETDWHHGAAFPKAIKHDEFDHYGAVIGAKDAVVHPVTAFIALKQYEETKDKEYLQTAQAELEEIIGQLDYIK